MEQALTYAFSVFSNFISLMFNDFVFTAFNYSVSVGWLLLGVVLIGMVLNSILNIPSMMPNRVFLSPNDRMNRATKSSMFHQRATNTARFLRGNKGEQNYVPHTVEYTNYSKWEE